jgi:cytochrome c oxidase subunit 4
MAMSNEAVGSAVEAVAKRPYIPVFAVLGILTAIEIQIPGLAVSKASQIFLLMVFAIGKASLVVLYYMHLRYEPRLLSLVPLIPLFMALALAITLAI